MPKKTATLAPPPRPQPTPTAVDAKLRDLLKTNYAVEMPSRCNIIVEGQTDRDYLAFAAAKVREQFGQDWLAVPPELGAPCIDIVAPGGPGAPNRGGADRLVDLGRELLPYYFTLETFCCLAFVLDFDDAGEKARKNLCELSYADELHVFKLYPKKHERSCFKQNGMCVEDLLSLDIQRRYFDAGGASCRAHHDAGKLVRFGWDTPSKAGLRDYVLQHGRLQDVWEVARLLYRIRSAWGFPTDDLLTDDNFGPAPAPPGEITWADFERVDLRAGTVTAVEEFPEARRPAFKLWIDFGPELGVRKASAQVTDRYAPADLVGRQVVAVVNFPRKQVGPFMSEVLVTGFADADGAIVLAQPERPVPNGARLA